MRISARLTLCFLLAACLAFVRGREVANAGEVVTSELRLASGHGCYLKAGAAAVWSSLLRRHANVAVYIEAETAGKLTLQEGKSIADDARCGGGRFLEFVTHAEYPFEVPGAGTYQGWARRLLPRKGSWSHKESMDAGEPHWVRDSESARFGDWVWSRLGSYELPAGGHTFVLHNWLGGAQLDALLFTSDPDLDMEQLQGTPSSLGSDFSGRVMTDLILPSQVASLQKVAFAADLNGGTIGVEISVDGGTRWIPVADTGDLSEVAVRGDGTDALCARLSLSAAADGASPVLRSVRLAYEIDSGAEVRLGNSHSAFLLSRTTGSLCGIVNRLSGAQYIPAHLQQRLVALSVRQPGATEQRDIEPAEFKFGGIEQGEGYLRSRFLALDGQIDVDVEMHLDADALCRWRCSVRNRSSLEVIRIDFPLLRDVAMGSPDDDECVLPRTGGLRLRNPARGKRVMTTYLGGGSMAWMDLCDAEQGLYLAMHDRELATTELVCEPAVGASGVDLAFRTHTLVQPGQATTREFVVGVHPGDWHWAADRYRDWAWSWMKRPDSPEWLRMGDGWVHASGRNKFDVMTGLLRRAELDGFDYLQYWGHMADGLDQCCGNFYWPAPALGGADAFRRGIAAVQAAGGRVTAYMNCQTWTRDSATNDALRRTPKADLPQEALELIHPLSWFEKWRLCPLDGKPMGYYAGTLGWYIMCPASRGFQEHLRFWIVDMYCKRFGADGVYIDQTGATAAKPCYNLDHGHADIGCWGRGNVDLLGTCIEQARQHNPDFILAIEGAGDALGQYADLHLISGLCTHPEVYHYTFPDHILISGYSNHSHLTAHQRISRAFLNGDRFDARMDRRHIQPVLWLRQRIKRWLYPGRFMDTVGLSVSDERVLARWTLCDLPGERAIVITVDNEHAAEGTACRLQLPAGWDNAPRLYVFDLEGGVESLAARIEAGVLSLVLPPSQLSAVLLLRETAPNGSIDAWCAVGEEAVGPPAPVELLAVNYSAAPRETSIALSCDAPLSVSRALIEATVPEHGVWRDVLRIEHIERLTQPARVVARASWDGGSRESVVTLRPVFMNGGLDVDIDGNGCPDGWEPGGTTSSFPHGIEDGAFWMTGQPKQFQYLIQRVPLQPSTEYSFAGRIRRSGVSKGVSIAVVEFVGERGYRVHKIGGGETLPAERWQRFETRFTTGADFRMCAVYLYNTHTDVTAWYDDIELRETQ